MVTGIYSNINIISLITAFCNQIHESFHNYKNSGFSSHRYDFTYLKKIETSVLNRLVRFCTLTVFDTPLRYAAA